MKTASSQVMPGERWLFAGIGLLLAISILAVMAGRLNGVAGSAEPLPVLTQSRLLVFEDTETGDIAIRDAATRELVGSYTTGEGGFARTALRSLAYSRRLSGKGSADPFLLAQADDGRILLHDPATMKTIGINAFGADNVDQFGFLLADEGATP
jgi:putative photosynthetic complex assembly protein